MKDIMITKLKIDTKENTAHSHTHAISLLSVITILCKLVNDNNYFAHTSAYYFIIPLWHSMHNIKLFDSSCTASQYSVLHNYNDQSQCYEITHWVRMVTVTMTDQLAGNHPTTLT